MFINRIDKKESDHLFTKLNRSMKIEDMDG